MTADRLRRPEVTTKETKETKERGTVRGLTSSTSFSSYGPHTQRDAKAPGSEDGSAIDADILTASEAITFLRIGRNTLYDGCARGEIPHVRIGRVLRFSRRALLAWLGHARRASVDPWSTQVAEEGT